jgi:hypothetical protein
MKKTFKLKVENKNPDRLLEAVKHEIRKYIKREKNKPLPEGIDYWKFECKFAKNDDEHKVIDFVEITDCINAASKEDCETIYMEILSTPGIKEPKPEPEVDSSEESETDDVEESEKTETTEEEKID